MVVVDRAARGGTGLTPRWERLAGLSGPGRLILAGGLDPENVGDAVSLVEPFGVDVSSGIETAPGKKDPKRMHAFVEAARSSATVSPPEGGSAAGGGEGGNS
jgi:phosphoribosylanthranilate isomerase